MEDIEHAAKASLWRILTGGCALGILTRTGEGTRAEAFRCTLAPRPPPA
jgi:hypothetical protein